ncbi:hypothetical protein [Paenibacillus apiarius]|uniref:Uncharacterized protein n=1 Tax=Paenibacillus apiarius TaxID=46240 RepID=A0ABT4DZ25_9BACL|nr:hypothetical protein [Paenibacillus apiarius]MBN3524268.1 hypothetical protein [Paenibacillus apiarius]MCY9514063.1 hypothetical protein [Paenibacillus apiarius]MCY9522597.1 hypothetical protein [Paenibacillus apiarius]MCY9553023.1 hypothetical protein [Paenibacillus apiarius]MCY9556336.1 hypothetical protein [Paenibacillus apiarius]
MKSSSSAWSDVDLIGKLADMKEDQYRLTLALSTLMELLVEKGLLTHEDIALKAEQLELWLTDEPETSHEPCPTA